MLHSRKKKFTNLSFISIGLSIVGLIAAMICNLGFSRGLLGFCLASVFLVAATICQICFTVSFRMLIDEEEAEHAEEIKKANTDMVFSSVKIFFGILLTFAFCLPIAVLTHNSYYGMVIDSWLLFGSLFAAVAFLLGFCIYKLCVIKLLVAKEFVYLSEAKIGALNYSNKLLKKCCSVFAIVFVLLMAGLVTVSVIEENHSFIEIKKFSDPDAFIEYVQNQYDEWYEEGYGEIPNGDFTIRNPDLDPDFSYPGYPNNWEQIDGKDYYYNPDLYHLLDVFEYEPGKYDITVITNEAFYNGRDTVDTLNSIFVVLHIFNLLACSAWYCIGALKKKGQ